MKNSYIILSGITLISISNYNHCTLYQNFDTHINSLQQSIDVFINQSNIDPEIAQDLINSTNQLNHYLQNNIQQDLKDIRVAAAISSLLETASQTSLAETIPNVSIVANNLKLPVHINTLHTLLLGAYPGALKDEPYYTNPYAESVGFIVNDWMFNTIFSAILIALAPTSLGKSLALDPT